MCGPTKRRKGGQPSKKKELGRVEQAKFFESALSFLDPTSLVFVSRVSTSLQKLSSEAARAEVLRLIAFFSSLGEVELSGSICTERAKVESWAGLLHGLEEESFEITLSSYIFESKPGGQDVPRDRGISALCAQYGFSVIPATEREDAMCPFDGLPTRLLTFTNPMATMVEISEFCGGLRTILDRCVDSGSLVRASVDSWSSWRLSSLHRYENYYDFDSDNPFRFILRLPPYDFIARTQHLAAASKPPPKSPRGSPRMSLVLDLDETLIHTETEPIMDADFVFNLTNADGGYQRMHCRIRPHCGHFLREAAKRFEIIVFTASERHYAENVLRHLDPTGTLVDRVLCRENCTFVEGEFLKDLGTLDRDLSRVVIVDNRPECYAFHTENGIPISSWFEDRRDFELLRLLPNLSRLQSEKDVRDYVRHHWRIQDHLDRVAGYPSRPIGLVSSESDLGEPGDDLFGSETECASDRDVCYTVTSFTSGDFGDVNDEVNFIPG